MGAATGATAATASGEASAAAGLAAPSLRGQSREM
jgi:hypothetical protein